jgi:hypothetical protein
MNGWPIFLITRSFYPATRAGDKFVCVAVKVTGSDAFALTAYLTDKPKKGTVLWDANS